MKNYPNKMIQNADQIDFHFAGHGAHPPITIKAVSEADAREKYFAMLAGKPRVEKAVDIITK
jgi:hypothetical protein